MDFTAFVGSCINSGILCKELNAKKQCLIGVSYYFVNTYSKSILRIRNYTNQLNECQKINSRIY